MNYNLVRGEWIKIAGNRLVAIMLVWSAPIGAIMLLSLVILAVVLSPNARIAYANQPSTWDEILVGAWAFINNEIGRLIISVFAAVIFAGEYQYGTWKNFVHHRGRVILLLNKFLTMGLFIVVSWVSFSLILTIGMGIVTSISGGNYGEINSEIVSQVARDYGLAMFTTLTGTLIVACYAALAAMFTRSIVASVFVAFIVSVAETVILFVLFLIYNFLDIDLIRLYTYTPSYNLNNITAWVLTGAATRPPPMGATDPHTLGASLLIVAVWVIVLISLTLWAFKRQDITT